MSQHIAFVKSSKKTQTHLVLKQVLYVSDLLFKSVYSEKTNLKFNFMFKVCVCVKGRLLQIYNIENGETSLYKEITLPELCLRMVRESYLYLKKK